jgi:hypothetical protein
MEGGAQIEAQESYRLFQPTQHLAMLFQLPQPKKIVPVCNPEVSAAFTEFKNCLKFYPWSTPKSFWKLLDLIFNTPNLRDHIRPITVYDRISWSPQSYMKHWPVLCAIYLNITEIVRFISKRKKIKWLFNWTYQLQIHLSKSHVKSKWKAL